MNGYRLSPGQRLAWEGGFPLLTARVELAEPPEPARLQAAWAAVVGQHEALRLTLIRHSGLRVPLQDVDDRREPFVGGQGEVSLTVAGATLTLAVTPLFGDPASLRLVLADLAAAYAGRPPAEDPDRLQYLDVCEWQREAREAAGSREPAALADASPADASLAAVAHPPAPTTEHLLPAAELRARAAELDVPVGSLLLAAWTMALARFAEVAPGTTDAGLALAAWTDGRYVPGTETVVGPLGGFARARVELPLPVDPAAAVRLVHTAQQAAEQDHHLTEPAGPVAGSFGCWPAADPTALAGLAATGVRIGEPTPPGGPCLFAEVGAEAVRLVLTAAEPLRESLLAILAGLPAALADGVPLAARGPREEAWLIGASGAGQAAEHRPTTLTALLDAGIAAAPADAPAVIAADGRLSFAELSRAGDAVAAGLARAGVRRGDRVAVLAGRTTGTVAAMLGILRAGAVYLPLDPASPQPRSAALVEAAGARFVIGDQIVEGVASATVAELTAGSAWTGERGESSPLDPAYLIFTSGSTGEPRGVLVSQASAAHLVAALEAGVYRDGPDAGRVAVNAPLTFDASIKQLVQLANGRTLCLIPEEVRLDGQDLAATLAEYEVGTLDITPSHLQLLLAAPQPYLPRQLLIGGEPIPAELWQRLAELPSVRAVNVYGPTECTVDSTAAEVLPGTEPNIGRPLPGTEVWVLDEHLRPVPPQVSGELCVAGPQVALGYLGDDAATERRFVEVSLPGGGRRRVYRTGDLVRFDAEARLHFLGRIDNQVKIRGHRIEPAEIEAVLAGHPAVGEAVVVARDDDGQGKRLVGYLRPAGTAVSVDLAELQGVNPHETRYLYDEIFQQQVYLQHGITLREGAVVFDVGANIGMFSLFVHAACPGATIHAFEPIPQVHSALRANVDRYAVPAVLHDFGLSATAGEVEFTYYPGYSVMSGQADYADPAAEVAVIKRYLSNEVAQGDSDGATLLARADELLADRFTASTVRVTLQPLSAVIDAAAPPRIDLLKIDVQRAEADVLAGIAERHWALIDQIAMEVHDAIGTETEGRVDELTELLERHGFEVAISQDALLAGTDRYMLHAARPEYADDPRPAARIAPAVPEAEQLAEVRGWLAQRLPGYLVPDVLVLVDRFPLTRNGKLDRAALPAPAPATAAGRVVAPDNAAERILLAAWQEALGIDQIGVTDNFFAIGGDSIRSIQVQASAARAGLTFRLRDIFTYQTVRELVEHGEIELADRQPGDLPEAAGAPGDQPFAGINPLDRSRLPAGLADAYPMTVLQQGMVYHCEVSGDPAMYHNVTAHLVSAPLDAAALRAALVELVDRHAILRTGFVLGTFSEPLQLVHTEVEPELLTHELAGLPAEQQRLRIDELVEQERDRPFDWARPPLVRLQAATRDAGSFWLLVAEHHAILDGWSLHLLLHELLVGYDRHRLGAGAPAVAPPPGYRRFVELERATLADPVIRRNWSDRLAALQPLLLSEPSPRITRIEPVPLPAGTAGRVRQAAEEAGVPVKSYLLGVHLRVLAESTGRHDPVTGLVFGGRPEDEGADRTLGLFLNTLPVGLLTGSASLADLAAQAWRAERDLVGFHRFPLAELTRIAGRPLFDTFFNFTRFHDLPETAGSRIVDSRGIPVDVAFAFAADVELSPGGDELALNLHYDARRFDDDRIAGLAGSYHRLLTATEPRQVLPPAGPAPVAVATDPWTRAVAGLWQEIIGTTPHTADADFFAAGGDSLRALRMVAGLRDRHGSRITLAEFTELRTLGALAEKVGSDA